MHARTHTHTHSGCSFRLSRAYACVYLCPHRLHASTPDTNIQSPKSSSSSSGVEEADAHATNTHHGKCIAQRCDVVVCSAVGGWVCCWRFVCECVLADRTHNTKNSDTKNKWKFSQRRITVLFRNISIVLDFSLFEASNNAKTIEPDIRNICKRGSWCEQATTNTHAGGFSWVETQKRRNRHSVSCVQKQADQANVFASYGSRCRIRKVYVSNHHLSWGWLDLQLEKQNIQKNIGDRRVEHHTNDNWIAFNDMSLDGANVTTDDRSDWSTTHPHFSL